MSKHTPGPWFHYDDTPRRIHGHEIAATGKTVARIYCTKGDEAEDAANARLIAAAPDLLEALEWIVNNHFSDPGNMVSVAKEALAKAKGN